MPLRPHSQLDSSVKLDAICPWPFLVFHAWDLGIVLHACRNSPIRAVSGDALVNGTPRQKDGKGKNVRSATKGSPRKRKSAEEGKKKTRKKKKPEYGPHSTMQVFDILISRAMC